MTTLRRYRLAVTAVALLVAGACGGSQGSTAHGAASGDLESRSGVACRADADCAVCYRAGTCGEAVAANDPGIDAPACHTAPSAFCMPRRAHCDDRHCVAR